MRNMEILSRPRHDIEWMEPSMEQEEARTHKRFSITRTIQAPTITRQEQLNLISICLQLVVWHAVFSVSKQKVPAELITFFSTPFLGDRHSVSSFCVRILHVKKISWGFQYLRTNLMERADSLHMCAPETNKKDEKFIIIKIFSLFSANKIYQKKRLPPGPNLSHDPFCWEGRKKKCYQISSERPKLLINSRPRAEWEGTRRLVAVRATLKLFMIELIRAPLQVWAMIGTRFRAR